MVIVAPAWGLTDEALTLILHAQNDISSEPRVVQFFTEPGRGSRLGGTFSNQSLLREVAVLRLLSAVEAFVDAASEKWYESMNLSTNASPQGWPARHKLYRKEHDIDLELCAGWTEVEAGIDLRNCIVHGLGRLTKRLTDRDNLGVRMQRIDVQVAGNRMRLTHKTLPALSSGCREFVAGLESKLIASIEVASPAQTQT